MKKIIFQRIATVLLGLVVSISFAVPVVGQQNNANEEGSGAESGFASFEEVKSEMNNITIQEVNFDETKISTVISFFKKKASFNIHVDDSVPTSQTVTLGLKNVSLGSLMELVLRQAKLDAMYRNGIVQVVREGDVKNLEIRAYDVRDLLLELKDFPGPELKLRDPEGATEEGSFGGSEGGGGEGGIMGTPFDRDSGGGNQSPITDTSKFKELVQNNTGGGESWRNGTLSIKNGIMIVKQSPNIHKEILYLINRLRKFK